MLAGAAHADDGEPVLPAESARWELGLGASAVHLPHYIGSDEAHQWLLPIPYFVYRGDHLQVDRNFIHGGLFERGRLKIDLSLSGTPPVDSDENDARRGMPDLDALGEIGTAFQYTLNADERHIWRVDLALRKAVATDFRSLSDAGYNGALQLYYAHVWQDGLHGGDRGQWRLESSLGPVFGNARYHDYLYGVDAAYATDARPAYRADGGQGGWRWSLGVTRREGRFWIGAFIRGYQLDEAVFADSPLVRERDSVFAGVAMAWIFHRGD